MNRLENDLSPRQQEALAFIRNYTGQTGYPPTLREIAGHMGIRGLHAVRKHLDALVLKGYLTREKGARTLFSGKLHPKAVPVPVLGRVAAGSLRESPEDHTKTWFVDPDWLPEGPSFFLQVRGDSMKDAAILDGDYVLVRSTPDALPGEIVVAMIDGESTVKRLSRKGDQLVLSPENPDYSDIPVPTNADFRIAGVVVGVIRLPGA